MILKTDEIYYLFGQKCVIRLFYFKICPTGGFKWFDRANLNLDKFDNNSSRDSILELDLEYPA